jgi:hypothetical protein
VLSDLLLHVFSVYIASTEVGTGQGIYSVFW